MSVPSLLCAWLRNKSYTWWSEGARTVLRAAWEYMPDVLCCPLCRCG